MTDIVIQGIGGRMGHVLCDMIAQREDCCGCVGGYGHRLALPRDLLCGPLCIWCVEEKMCGKIIGGNPDEAYQLECERPARLPEKRL